MCFDAKVLAPAAAGDDLGDGSTPVRLLGGEEIVGVTADLDVRGVVAAALAAGIDVVVLEPGAAFAAGAIGAVPGAAQAVALDDGAPDTVRQAAGW